MAARTLPVPYGKDLRERAKCPQSAAGFYCTSQCLCKGMESGTCMHLLANADFRIVFWKSVLRKVS